MFFKKLEMHGFKSFAEPVTIEFNEGITGVVGPNGSGKSNISDAIRWVLGEQSPKMLRGGKMEEVIFAGTSSRKSRGMAEVTLVIDNADGSLPIDFQEVAITRRMFRSGESEYQINGNQCRLRDIRELIMDTGIGVDGYSLIGQGKISDIISNKTESRREIFEEAAGVVAYRTKKAESERKLKSTSDNMERVQDIIGEIEGRIDTLKDDSIKAKEYLKLREKYQELEINIILKNIENLELKNEYAKDDLAELGYAIETLKEEKTETDSKLAENVSKQSELEKLAEETRTQLMTAIEELNKVVNKADVDREKLAANEDNTQRLSAEIEQLAAKKEREEANKDTFAESKKSIDEEADAANRELQKQVDVFNEMTNEMTALTEEIDGYKNDIFEMSGAINSKKAEINSLVYLQETLSNRYQNLIAEKDSGDSSNRETLDNLSTIRKEKEEIDELLSTYRDEEKLKTDALEELLNKERMLVREAEELRLSQGQKNSRKKTIEEMESNYEGYNYAVKHVMKSGLTGIHGVVADLIEVPEGFEVAIETALGAAVQNIVCEDDASAKKAIVSLKQNKAGRMTFLPVKSIVAGGRPGMNLSNEKGFLGFGNDIVKTESKYDNILFYLLGRVAIVDNMDNAISLSKSIKGYRIVTLDGEIINAGGAITGGKYKNKSANILDRKAEISSLKKDLDEIAGRLEEIRVDREKAGDRSAQLRSELMVLTEEIKKTERLQILKENEISLAENVLNDIRTSSEKLDRELESIKAEQNRSVNLISKLEDEISKLSDELDKTEKKSEDRLDIQEAKKAEFDEISETITKARIEVSGLQNKKEHFDDMMDRINNTIREIEADIEIRQTQLAELSAEKSELTSGHSDVDTLIGEKEDAKDHLETYLAEITEEKATVTETVNKLNADKNAAADKLEMLQTQKYDLDIRKTRNETQLANYKDKLWEEFEVSYIQAMEFKSDKFVMSTATRESREIKNRMKELGDVNVGAIEEYEKEKERFDFLTEQRDDIQEAMDNLNEIIADMDKTIKAKFRASFDAIVDNFEEKFTELFGGGHAELRLSDADNPLESEIDIIAQPPGKKLQNINLLSGGEKTLTAIALMFAVLQAKPTPFCILDEVEAALDDANIDRFINTLRTFNGIQFTLVTHQKATMEHADALYGVTMPEKGVSKVLSLSMDDNFEI